MAGGFRIGFDENGDVVVEDIPDDIMRAIEGRATANGRTIEEEVRSILLQLSRRLPSHDEERE